MPAGAPDDLEALADRAVEAALGAGAGDAEAAAQDSVGREIRVFGGEVESLSAAGERGLGVRAWIDGRVGFAYGTDLGSDGVAAIAADAVEAARVSDADEFAAAARARMPRRPRPTATTRPPRWLRGTPTARSSWRRPSSARRSTPTIASSRSRPPSTSTRRCARRSALRRGLGGAYEATFAYAYLQAIAEGDAGKQTGLGFGLGRSPAALDPRRSAARAPSAPCSCSARPSPPSRSCPVVLDPTVAASFAGFIGGVLCADSVQRGRSPFADRLGEEIASEALALTDDGIDHEGMASAPIDAEGLAARPHAADRGRPSRRLSARLLHGSPRGRRPAIDRQRRALGVPLGAHGRALEPRARPRARGRSSSCSPTPATAST